MLIKQKPKQQLDWTPEEVNILTTKYLESKSSLEQIASLYLPNRTFSSCRNKVHALKLISPRDYWMTYDCDKGFWQTPNPLNCYWAGYASNDGCIESGKCLNLEISVLDRNHLEKFKSDTKYNGIIYDNFRKDKTHCIRMRVHCKEWIKDLKNIFGIVPRKVNRTVPNINNEYLKFCFLIGQLCADGHICFTNSSSGVSGMEIGMCSSCHATTKWNFNLIYKYFENSCIETRPSREVRTRSGGKASVFSINGIRACVLYDFIRKFDIPKLERKWNNLKFIHYVNQRKDKYPELFSTNEELYQNLLSEYQKSLL